MMKRLVAAIVLALAVCTYAPQFSVQALAVDCPYLTPVSFSIQPDGTSEKTLVLNFSGYTSATVTITVRDSGGVAVTGPFDVPTSSPYVLTLPTIPGTYTIQVTGANSCGTLSGSQGPLVVPPPASQEALADPALPTSGNDSFSRLRIASVLVLCGVGFVGVGWRRRRGVRAANAAT